MAVIRSKYGPRFLFGRNFHGGVDHAAPIGSPIYTNKPMTVTRAGQVHGYGNAVYAVDSNGVEHIFGHSDSIPQDIKPGTQLAAGDKIAYTGNSGDSTGPHLHYEVRKNGRKFDPLKTIDPLTGKNYTYNASFEPNGQSLGLSKAAKDPTYKPQAPVNNQSGRYSPPATAPNSTIQNNSNNQTSSPQKITTSINPLLELGDN